MNIKWISVLIFLALLSVFAYLASRGSAWERYYRNTIYQPPRSIIVQVIRSFTSPGKAIDLGCGAGNEVAHALHHGWKVWAIDGEAKAIHILKKRHDISAHDNLHTTVARFEELDWSKLPSADLIYAACSLPFCPPDAFTSVWSCVAKKIYPEGRFAAIFFGPNYSGFYDPEKITILTREEVLELFEGFEVEYFQEEEEDGVSDTSSQCHFHIFYVIAKKRSLEAS